MNAIVSPREIDDGLTRAMPGHLVRWGILGRLIWWLWQPTEWHAYFQSIERQVRERGPVPEGVWGTPQRLAIAKRIEEILGKVCWPKRLSFHPDDPWLVIGELQVGDLSEVEALMEIEEQFCLDLPEDFVNETAALLTFGDLVTIVQRQGTRLPD